MAGLMLDQWQQFVLVNALGERPDGKWSAFEVGIEVARQNGKGGILEARELVGLFLLGERLIIHSAHEFATAIKAFDRMVALIEGCPDFARRLKPRGGITRSHGFEGIHLKGGQSLEYRTRTKGGGRGFSGDCLIFDEAMHIPEAMHSALFPLLAARPNPQIIYTGSAVDEETMDNGVVFARVRERGIKGDDPRLAYFGWSPDIDHPSSVTPEQAVDPKVWAQANPALGIRITQEYIEAEQRSLSARGFAVERLSVGAWPDTGDDGDRKISDEQWTGCLDELSHMKDPVGLAVDVTPERDSSSIGAAGRRPDGLAHTEVVETRPGTGWVVDRVAALLAAHKVLTVVIDGGSPAASLAPDFVTAGVAVTKDPKKARGKVLLIANKDVTQACGMFYDAVADKKLRHLGTTELQTAVRGAATRPLGDAWAWARKTSTANISPLVACTLALWGLNTMRARRTTVVDLAALLAADNEDA